MIHKFGLRAGSGGKGEFNGGDGVVRDIEFTEPLQVSILSEVSHGVMPTMTGAVLIICFSAVPGSHMGLREGNRALLAGTLGSNRPVSRMVTCPKTIRTRSL